MKWDRWPRERLLDLRIRDLGLRLDGTWVESCIADLYSELGKRGITLRPHCWLSDEWFSPTNVPGIGIPFYLVHPRLIRLERSIMMEAEGVSRAECMRILRHEAGHAMQHGFRLHRRAAWRRMFGKSSTPYPLSYRPRPASRHFVQHLRAYYSQAHPDEDFAETFAVWMQPRARWERRYEGWPALKKLEYIDELMAGIGDAKQVLRSRARLEPLSRINTTLADHYAKKRSHYSVQYPDTYDRDLIRLFSLPPGSRRSPTAGSFLRTNRRWIRRMVSRWTGEYELTLDMVLTEMMGRCRELKLRAVGPPRQLRMDFAVLLTVQSMHALCSRSRRASFAL